MNKKIPFLIALAIIFLVIIVTSLIIILKYPGLIDREEKIVDEEEGKATIITDKEKYETGEKIKITIKNQGDEDILYDPTGDRIWNIEEFKEGQWNYTNYFQLTQEEIGEECGFLLYEPAFPIYLKSKEALSIEWDQRMCLFGNKVVSKVSYIDAGRYRFTFNYGFYVFEILKGFDDLISDTKTIYSNEFIIR